MTTPQPPPEPPPQPPPQPLYGLWEIEFSQPGRHAGYSITDAARAAAAAADAIRTITPR